MIRALRAPRRLLALLAALLVVVAGIGIAGTVAPTQAAWTDRVSVSAVATGGTWSVTPTPGTCTAKEQSGGAVSCSITKIEVSFDSWNNIASYYVTFSAANAKWVSFTANLTTATAKSGSTAPPSSFWTKAGLVSAPHFTTTPGWTCASLPTISANANEWQTGTVYFTVRGDKTAGPTICP